MNKCIEGDKISLDFQNLTPYTRYPREIKTLQDTKCIIFPFSLKINGKGIISKQNSICDECGAPTHRVNESACLEINALVEGRTLWGFSSNPRLKLKVGEAGVRSGGHSRQSTEVSGICYLEVYETNWGRIDSVHPQDIYLIAD